MKYPKLRELKEAVKALIMGPYTSRFPYKPHRALEGFRGKTEFHEKECIGCAACAQVCPTGAITFKDELAGPRPRRVLTVRWDICVFCGNCQLNCLTGKGVVLSGDYDLSTTQKRDVLRQTIEKDLVLCECCGDAIAPADQFYWAAEKLGPLVFSNASLMLFYLGRISLAQTSAGKPPSGQEVRPAYPAGRQEIKRQDRVRILCPKCRREAAAKS